MVQKPGFQRAERRKFSLLHFSVLQQHDTFRALSSSRVQLSLFSRRQPNSPPHKNVGFNANFNHGWTRMNTNFSKNTKYSAFTYGYGATASKRSADGQAPTPGEASNLNDENEDD